MSKYTSEEIEANTSNIGIKLYNKLVKSTSLKLKEMDNREIWSVKAKACIYRLSDSEPFKEDYDTLPKYKSRLGNQFDYIFEDNMYLWYWLATGCVLSMVAWHYRIMYRTGMRSLYGQQSRNIGEKNE